MSNLTTVTLTTGVPTAGTGTVSTLDNLIGTAGTASAQVQTVQGIASMTALKVDGSAVTQPVSIATAPALVASSATIGSVKVTDGTNTATVKAVSTAPVTATDQALVVAMRPDSPGIISTGTAGSASSTVLTVQGIASMTALKVDGSGVTQPVSGTVATTNSIADPALSKFATGKYVTVAASTGPTTLQTSAGATGDYISGILVIPTTVSPGAIVLTDNATAITVFAGGTSSLSNLVPFFIPLGAVSASGAWKITTLAGASVIAVGKFS